MKKLLNLTLLIVSVFITSNISLFATETGAHRGAIGTHCYMYGQVGSVKNSYCGGISKSSQSSSTSSTKKTNSQCYRWHNSPKGWWYGDKKSYKTGWAKISSKYYWFNKYGYVNTRKGWEKCKHGWAYSLGSNGYYTSTTKSISGVTYNFDANGYAHKK